MTYALEQLDVAVSYVLMPTALKIDLRILNTTAAPLYLNACAFLLSLAQTEASYLTSRKRPPIYHCESTLLENRKPVRRVLSTLPPTRLYPEAT